MANGAAVMPAWELLGLGVQNSDLTIVALLRTNPCNCTLLGRGSRSEARRTADGWIWEALETARDLGVK